MSYLKYKRMLNNIKNFIISLDKRNSVCSKYKSHLTFQLPLSPEYRSRCVCHGHRLIGLFTSQQPFKATVAKTKYAKPNLLLKNILSEI